MAVLKKLVKGELSLAVTFWGFLVLGGIIPSAIVSEAFSAGNFAYSVQTVMVLAAFLIVIKFIIVSMATSGIFFMLRNKKITFLSVIAFIIAIFNLIQSTYGMLSILYIFYLLLTSL